MKQTHTIANAFLLPKFDSSGALLSQKLAVISRATCDKIKNYVFFSFAQTAKMIPFPINGCFNRTNNILLYYKILVWDKFNCVDLSRLNCLEKLLFVSRNSQKCAKFSEQSPRKTHLGLVIVRYSKPVWNIFQSFQLKDHQKLLLTILFSRMK